jgi:hypothetical protein
MRRIFKSQASKKIRSAFSSVGHIAPVERCTCIILVDFRVPKCVSFCQISVIVKYVLKGGYVTHIN